MTSLTWIHCSSSFSAALQLLDDVGTAFSGGKPSSEELAVSVKELLLDSQPVLFTAAQPDKTRRHTVSVIAKL